MPTKLRSLSLSAGAFSPGPAVWGLVAALVLMLGLGVWFAGQAIAVARQDAEMRKATVAAMSLSDLVAATTAGARAATGADPTPDRLSAMVDVWRSGDDGVLQARIVRRADGFLLASTDRADAAAGPLPRRLVRAEKRLFDLAYSLAGNIDSNVAENLARLAEVDITAAGPDFLRVTAPVVLADGTIWGVVQVDRTRKDATESAGLILGLGLGMLAVGLMAGLARAGAGLAVSRPVLYRWAGFIAAAALLILTALVFTRVELTTVADARLAQVGEVGEVQARLAAAARQVAAIAGAPLSGTAWDVDSFRRPIGQIGVDGTVDAAAVEQGIAAVQAALTIQLRITLVLALGLLAFIALGGAARLAATVREHRTAYGYVMPAMLGMLVLVFFPFTYGLILSFTDRTLVNQSVPLTDLWVGFANYVRILADVDVLRWTPDGVAVNYESFYWTLFITVCWTVANVAIGVTIGLILALALNTEGLRGKTIYRVLLILPWAIPNYITALTWKGMFHPQFGVINQVIVMVGGEPVQWFDGVFTSFMTGVVTNGWLSFPFMMVIILGALAAIPSDMYEAAKLDGASRWQQFRMITLPLLKPALIPAVILSVVWTFNMFNVIYLVSGGEPGGANEILITKAYKLAFERYQYAYAAAYSMVIFLILLAYGIFQNRATKATEAVN
ncbi:MAG: Maltose transport system permease protein MalF [Pseudomonadota bacterium]